jgi:hypothetical protein
MDGSLGTEDKENTGRFYAQNGRCFADQIKRERRGSLDGEHKAVFLPPLKMWRRGHLLAQE